MVQSVFNALSGGEARSAEISSFCLRSIKDNGTGILFLFSLGGVNDICGAESSIIAWSYVQRRLTFESVLACISSVLLSSDLVLLWFSDQVILELLVPAISETSPGTLVVDETSQSLLSNEHFLQKFHIYSAIYSL